MMLGSQEAVLREDENDGEDPEGDSGIAGGFWDRQDGTRDRDGDGPPGTDVRRGEAAVALEA